jgi:phosphoglucomutase
VEKIVREEGFALNPAKSRVMRRHARQMITGIVVNAHCNVPRAEFDALKAILFNCIRHGPAAQNHENIPDFRRHLEGRVAWVAQINPRRGEKLCALFDRIEW